tara:strand:- start:9638 stop:10255 length:618 start_codon:yes stop_codon:yes gene_type:complete
MHEFAPTKRLRPWVVLTGILCLILAGGLLPRGEKDGKVISCTTVSPGGTFAAKSFEQQYLESEEFQCKIKIILEGRFSIFLFLDSNWREVDWKRYVLEKEQEMKAQQDYYRNEKQPGMPAFVSRVERKQDHIVATTQYRDKSSLLYGMHSHYWERPVEFGILSVQYLRPASDHPLDRPAPELSFSTPALPDDLQSFFRNPEINLE